MKQLRRYLRYTSLTVGAGVLVVFFNNCDKGFLTMDTPLEGAFASSSNCEDSLMAIYQSTYHSFLSQSCAECHIAGPGLGRFASPNLKVSYDSFASIGADKINAQAINDNHKPPATGAKNTARINELKSAWASAQDKYVSCLAGQGGGGGSSEFVVKSDNRAVPTNLATTFVRMEWDLETQSTAKVPVVAGIEIRRAVLNTVTQGYEFRNPTLRLKNMTSGNYYARALNLYINNALQTDVTTYSNIEVTINSTTNINLAPGAANAWAVRQPATTDVVAMEFSTLKSDTGEPNNPNPTPTPSPTPEPTPTPTPTVVTFSQLAANGGVFANSCFSCHSAGNPRGGLDLTNYNSARTAAANIRARVNNANNPMPTGGLLPVAQRNLINAWVDGGAPQ